MQSNRTQKLTRAALVGAAYAVLSLLGSVFGISYGPFQCRFAEALCVLPYLFPETAWGLGVGCLIANVLSPYGLPDILLGALTTWISALLTARCRCKWLAPLPPVVLNGLIIGGLLAFEQTNFSGAFAASFFYNAVTVAIGEAIACCALGLLLLRALQKRSFGPVREKINP